MNDKELEESVRKDVNTFRFIKNPSLEIRYQAVNMCSSMIFYIPDPTEEEQLLAVRRDPKNIKYIKNQTISAQIEAIRANITMCSHLENRSLEIQLEVAIQFLNIEEYPEERYAYVNLDDEHPDMEIYDIILQEPYMKIHHRCYEFLLIHHPDFHKRIKDLPGILQQLNRDTPYELDFNDYDIEFRYE